MVYISVKDVLHDIPDELSDYILENIQKNQGGQGCWHLKSGCHGGFYNDFGSFNFVQIADGYSIQVRIRPHAKPEIGTSLRNFVYQRFYGPSIVSFKGTLCEDKTCLNPQHQFAEPNKFTKPPVVSPLGAILTINQNGESTLDLPAKNFSGTLRIKLNVVDGEATVTVLPAK
jgi:hypothetical protein